MEKPIFGDISFELDFFDVVVRQNLSVTSVFQSIFTDTPFPKTCAFTALVVHRIIFIPFSFIKIVFELGIVLKRLDLIGKHNILYLNMLIS